MTEPLHPHVRIAMALERLASAAETFVKASKPKVEHVSVEAASDSELDGLHGDPLIKYGLKERYWAQPDPHQGRRYSECPIEYLRKTVEYLKGSVRYYEENDSDENRKKARYNRLDCARALGWIRRKEAGWKPVAESAQNGTGQIFGDGREPSRGGFDDDDIPF